MADTERVARLAPTAEAAALRTGPAPAPPVFRWYLAGQATWFVGLGLQMVLFPYLVADVLDKAPLMVGLAQMSIMAPQFLFLLLGGATADRTELRGLLIRLHLVAMVPPLTLSLVIATGHLRYEVLILYALAMGTLAAFAMPTRDAMLSRVLPAPPAETTASAQLQRAIALANAMQFAGQVIGMILASRAEAVGVAVLFASHAVILLVGAFTLARLPRSPSLRAPGSQRNTLAEIRGGIREAMASPVIRSVLIGTFATGLFFIGAFLVIIPVILREEYGGGVTRFAAVSLAFWCSTIAATLTLVRIGPVARKGRALILAYLCGLSVLAILSQPVPFAMLVCLAMLWGLGSGVAQTLSRTLVQEAALATHRGRILSLFQLGFSAGAPVGTLLSGILVQTVGPHQATLVSVAGMAGVLLYLRFGTALWHAVPPRAEPAPAIDPQL